MCSRTGGTAGEEGERRDRKRVKLNWILVIFMVARVQYNGVICNNIHIVLKHNLHVYMGMA